MPARPSVLGGGLLERARSTTLALLGVTAAVGLGIVALALNQSWPLIAGSPVPGPPPGDVAVGEARVAVAGPARGPRGTAAPASADAPRARGESSGDQATATPAPARSQEGADQLVAASKPVAAKQSPSGGGGDGRGPSPAPPPQTQAAQPPQPASTPTVSAPAPPPSGESEESPQSAAPASAPGEESFVPAWSEGNGHAYGRDRD